MKLVGPVVVMGVSGAGKTRIAGMLAERTKGVFLDGDDFHPPENKAKMAAAIPLTDEDRWGWLDAIHGAMVSHVAEGHRVFVACSALRQAYRDRLSLGLPQIRFVFLEGSKDLILQRLRQRQDHFMPPVLLESQFRTLEEPKDALVVAADASADTIVDGVLQGLGIGIEGEG